MVEGISCQGLASIEHRHQLQKEEIDDHGQVGESASCCLMLQEDTPRLSTKMLCWIDGRQEVFLYNSLRIHACCPSRLL
jgi:hypothetical protein